MLLTYTLIMLVVFLLSILGVVKARHKTIKYLWGSFAITAGLILTIGIVFALSEYFFYIYSNKPYYLSYKDILTAVTQIVSFLGATLIGATTIYLKNIKEKIG